jgi:hypothetical protein
MKTHVIVKLQISHSKYRFLVQDTFTCVIVVLFFPFQHIGIYLVSSKSKITDTLLVSILETAWIGRWYGIDGCIRVHCFIILVVMGMQMRGRSFFCLYFYVFFIVVVVFCIA